jgi:hypothetical protein
VKTLFLGPEVTTAVEPEPDPVAPSHPVVFVVTSNWFAVLGIVSVPPSLASALSCPAGVIISEAVLVRIAATASLLGLCWRSAFAEPISPTLRTQHIIFGWCAYRQREIAPTSWLWLGGVAKGFGNTLRILFDLVWIRPARLPFTDLVPTILHPIDVLAARWIYLAIIVFVRTIKVSVTSQTLIVRLQWLARTRQAFLHSVDAILVSSARHADLVTVTAHPIGPLY